MYSISESILAYLVFSDEYMRKVVIHLKSDYFDIPEEGLLFNLIKSHFNKFNIAPTYEEIYFELENDKTSSDSLIENIDKLISHLKDCPTATLASDNMFEKAEQFAKDQSLTIALSESLQIANDEAVGRTRLEKTAIPKLLSDALAVSFDNSVGHDYFEDYKARFEFYNNEEERIPFDLDILNAATNGGVTRGTLNMFLAGVNVGKSASLCSLASHYLTMGLNVLFVSMEMSEEVTAQRIDANILNCNINKLDQLDEVEYEKLIFKSKGKSKTGRLFIKQYPPLLANSNHIDNLIEEISTKKKGFKPDVIVVDYLGILGSSTVSMSGGVNTNTYFKFVSEELRALAVKHDAIVWTANQFNRGGFASSDPGLDDAAESFGVTATADFVLSLTTNEQLQELDQYYAKVLKTRYSKKKALSSFYVGIDFDHMRLFDLPESMRFDNDEARQEAKEYSETKAKKDQKRKSSGKINFN